MDRYILIDIFSIQFKSKECRNALLFKNLLNHDIMRYLIKFRNVDIRLSMLMKDITSIYYIILIINILMNYHKFSFFNISDKLNNKIIDMPKEIQSKKEQIRTIYKNNIMLQNTKSIKKDALRNIKENCPTTVNKNDRAIKINEEAQVKKNTKLHIKFNNNSKEAKEINNDSVSSSIASTSRLRTISNTSILKKKSELFFKLHKLNHEGIHEKSERNVSNDKLFKTQVWEKQTHKINLKLASANVVTNKEHIKTPTINFKKTKNLFLEDKGKYKTYLNFGLTSKNSFTPLGKLKLNRENTYDDNTSRNGVKPLRLTRKLTEYTQLSNKFSSTENNLNSPSRKKSSYRKLRNLKYNNIYKLKPYNDYYEQEHLKTEIPVMKTQIVKNNLYKRGTIRNLQTFISNFDSIEKNLTQTESKINYSYDKYPPIISQRNNMIHRKNINNKKPNKTEEKEKDSQEQLKEEYDFINYLEIKNKEPEVLDKFLVNKVKLTNNTLVDHTFISNNVARVITYGGIIGKMDNIKAFQMGKAINDNYIKYSKDLYTDIKVKLNLKDMISNGNKLISKLSKNTIKQKILTNKLNKRKNELV